MRTKMISTKRKKKIMAGGGRLMCRSHADVAVCMSTHHAMGSVIVPARLKRSSSSSTVIDHHDDNSRLIMSSNNQPATNMVNESPNNMSNALVRSKSEPHHKKIPVPTLLTSISDRAFQVVVMRVSLHCQGCAGKVKRHLSKMEGVTSFSIDLEEKRVTVMGHISPHGVLESVSKVKKAEFWPK